MAARVIEQGANLGKYQILTRLSVGGMAEIFLAVVSGPGGFRKFVTLKRILPELREQEEFVKMFLDEARISASLSHSNIAQVFDLASAGDELYMAMEFIAGKDLGAIVRECKRLNRPVPMGLSVMVARDVCMALQYAHSFVDSAGRSSPIIHRDISPNNLMLTYGGSLKVIDFGVAKAKGSLGKTAEGVVKGSTGYMSPEQLKGKPLDGRSDLFSMAVVLHEMLTGQSLFARSSELLTLRGLLLDEIPSPQKVNPGVPKVLSDVVMRALARDPSMRFSSGREMAEALEKAVPVLIFDQSKAGVFMADLFEDRLNKTRALLALADPSADPRSLFVSADRLSEVTPSHGRAAAATAVQYPSGVTPVVTFPLQPLPTGVMRLEQVSEKYRARAQDPTPTEVKARELPEGQEGGSRVMVVDDSEISRHFIEAHLQEAGYEVELCDSAEAALKALARELPDLVLLDVMMPDIDGFTLCRKIREQPAWRQVPVVFISAGCSLDERLKGLTVGGDDFIRKPYDAEELAARIRAHIQRVAFLRGQA